MFELKVIFVVLLCVPLLVASVVLVSKLLDEILKKQKGKNDAQRHKKQ